MHAKSPTSRTGSTKPTRRIQNSRDGAACSSCPDPPGRGKLQSSRCWQRTWTQRLWNGKKGRAAKPSTTIRVSQARLYSDQLSSSLFSSSQNCALIHRVLGLLTDRESLVHRFTSFLARAGMAPALDFGPEEEPIPSTSTSAPRRSFFPPPPPSKSTTSARRRLILLEDLPNVSHWPTKQALRSAVQQYLSSPRVTAPLVIIVSEALARPGDETGGGAGWLSGNGRRGESIDARGVLGVEILDSPACRHIACVLFCCSSRFPFS